MTNLKPLPYRLTLEIPFANRAKELIPSLSKITFSLEGKKETATHALARLLVSINNSRNTSIYFHAINQFVTPNKLFGSIADVTVNSSLNLVGTVNLNQVQNILEKWEAESLAVFFCDLESPENLLQHVDEVETKWWKFASMSEELPFLHFIPTSDPIAFYAMSHQSLDIYGTKEMILNCFENIRRLFLL